MNIRILSAGITGADAFPVDVEVDYARQGLPGFTLVGLPEAEVRESRERVFAAIRSAGYRLPPARVTVNLAPASRRKSGAGYDLPLALGLLTASGFIDPEKTRDLFFAAELSLSGELKPMRGMLPVAILAARRNSPGLVISAENATEAAMVEGVPIYTPATLVECVEFLRGNIELAPFPHTGQSSIAQDAQTTEGDFAEVKGQVAARRALEIAAAGNHNVLLIGSPGTGKSMMAKRLPGILPPLTFEEALDVTRIYSVAGKLNPDEGMIRYRPFRSPHHTTSEVAMIGGGSDPHPGEVSFAHRGVLFLDELPEYKRASLEALRQPLEDGCVTISRSAGTVTFPATFMLVAAMNPCPCGYLGDPARKCVCRPEEVARYRHRLSGPLLDRIDMHIQVQPVSFAELSAPQAKGLEEWSSSAIRQRVVEAREIQARRYRGSPILCNSELAGSQLERHCSLTAECRQLMRAAMDRLALSARAYARILRVARTIADLAREDRIKTAHLAEAIGMRILDRGSPSA